MMTENTPDSCREQTRSENHAYLAPTRLGRTTMFYDGGCPLCSREVAHCQRLDRGSRVQWIDIHTHRDAVDMIGVDYGEAMAQLHVQDRAGRVQKGVAAFAAVWEELPGYRWLARAVRALHLIPMLDRVYAPFARWRLKRRPCEAGACEKP